MRLSASAILLCILTACTTQQSASGNISSPNPVATGNKWVDRINEIKNIPRKTLSFSGAGIDSISWDCGDPLYWEIVRLKQEAIPYLLKKILDSSVTNIQVPCRGNKLKTGTVAVMVLDEIISIPYALVFERQWDALEGNCDFGYAMGLLEYMNEHPQEAYFKLSTWYFKYKKKIEKKALNPDYQTVCQKNYGINYELIIEY